MYQGKHSDRCSKKRHSGFRVGAMLLATLLLTALVIGGTVAYLTDKSRSVTNTFEPSHVACEVTENFDGTTKTNVNVKNTGETNAYIRVKLVSYRVNAAGHHIGGEAKIPAFALGENWVENNGYYYYTLPVKAGEVPAANLTDSITLTGSYNDADGGKQVIEVMAEAIQAGPEQAVGQAWGVSIAQGSVTAYAGN